MKEYGMLYTIEKMSAMAKKPLDVLMVHWQYLRPGRKTAATRSTASTTVVPIVANSAICWLEEA